MTADMDFYEKNKARFIRVHQYLIRAKGVGAYSPEQTRAACIKAVDARDWKRALRRNPDANWDAFIKAREAKRRAARQIERNQQP